jgi:hypothetical protein
MPGKSPDRVFFDWLGVTTVHYPVGLGWLILAGAIGAFGFALRRDGTKGLGAGAMRFAVLTAMAGLLSYAFNWISLGGESGEYYDRLAAIPRLEVIAALACLAAFVSVIGTWRSNTAAIVGFATPLLVLAIYGQAVAPTAIYFVALPLLLVALAIALPAGKLREYGAIAACVAVISYMLPLGHFVMQGVGAGMPYAAVLPFVLAVLAMLPLWQGADQRKARLTAGLAAGLALVLSLWVLLDAPADSVAVYADTKS